MLTVCWICVEKSHWPQDHKNIFSTNCIHTLKHRPIKILYLLDAVFSLAVTPCVRVHRLYSKNLWQQGLSCILSYDFENLTRKCPNPTPWKYIHILLPFLVITYFVNNSNWPIIFNQLLLVHSERSISILNTFDREQ